MNKTFQEIFNREFPELNMVGRCHICNMPILKGEGYYNFSPPLCERCGKKKSLAVKEILDREGE
jgi:hypothetical protein